MAQRAVPPLVGRHVYLWHGELQDLRALVPSSTVVELDLYSLAATLSKKPFALDEARRLLEAGIAAWLKEHLTSLAAHQVILVTGNSLLQRYRVPLDSFFQASSEIRLIVFAVSRSQTDYRPPRAMPSYVELEPSATFEYLRAKLGDHALVGDTAP